MSRVFRIRPSIMKDILEDILHAILLISVLLHKQDLICAKVTSQPPIQYVYRNDSTMLNCINTTESGTFINYIKQSIWYSVHSDGNNLITARYADSSPIFVHMYALVFNSVKEADQGQYKCCTPDGSDCSIPTTLSIAEDPIVEVAYKDYTGFLESNITLACKIIYIGEPPAKFHWRRHGEYVSNDLVYSNSTYTLLILTNLTEENSGLYRCVSDAVLSFYTYSIYLHLQVFPKLKLYGPNLAVSGTTVYINCTQLEGQALDSIYITTPQGVIVPDPITIFNATLNDTGNYTCTANTSLITISEEHYLLVYDVDNTTSFLTFLVILHNSNCDTMKEMNFTKEVSVALEKYIHDQVCECNISVTSIMFTCNSNTEAVYKVQITGFMARNVQQFLYNYHLAGEVDLNIALLYVCDHFCEQTTDIVETKSENTTSVTSTYVYNDDNTIAILLAICSLALLTISMIIIVLYSTSKFIRKQHCCIAQQETSMPQRNSQEMIPGVTNPSSSDDLPNVQVESEQKCITYTENPIYESSAICKETTMPTEAKRNEEHSRSSVIRNADALYTYLNGSIQNTFPIQYTDVDDMATGQDTAKSVYDTLSPPSFSARGHQPIQATKTSMRVSQSNNEIAIEDLSEATNFVTAHTINPSLPNHATILSRQPCVTDV